MSFTILQAHIINFQTNIIYQEKYSMKNIFR